MLSEYVKFKKTAFTFSFYPFIEVEQPPICRKSAESSPEESLYSKLKELKMTSKNHAVIKLTIFPKAEIYYNHFTLPNLLPIFPLLITTL